MGRQHFEYRSGNRSMEVFHLKFIILDVINAWLPYGTKHSLYFYGIHHIVIGK